MQIGLMNDPTASVYSEISSIGREGYDFVDLTVEGPRALNPDPEKVARTLQQYGLGVVGHTDPCLPYAYPIKSIRQGCLKELERCARLFSAVGATIMNIHPCYSRPPGMGDDLVKLNVEALKPIVDMAARYGLTVVFENFKAPFDLVSTHLRLVEEVPGLQLHLDFGHTNLGRDDGEAFCSRLGRHIKHVHFSDNRETDDHHMPLGVGTIDWKKAVSCLKRIGYDGTITLEVFCNDAAVLFEYLEISRKLVVGLWNR